MLPGADFSLSLPCVNLADKNPFISSPSLRCLAQCLRLVLCPPGRRSAPKSRTRTRRGENVGCVRARPPLGTGLSACPRTRRGAAVTVNRSRGPQGGLNVQGGRVLRVEPPHAGHGPALTGVTGRRALARSEWSVSHSGPGGRGGAGWRWPRCHVEQRPRFDCELPFRPPLRRSSCMCPRLRGA